MTTIGTWVDQGTIISNATGHNPLVPNVLFEANAQILSGTVFKMWYTALSAPVGIYYAESTDGLTWSQFASNPVIANHIEAKIFKNGSTYFLYAGNFPTPTQIDVYTSTDGINWTLQKSAALVVGTAGAWDSAVLTQLQVLDIVGGVWYGYYAGSATTSPTLQHYPAGLATSTDGINWTKSPSNPIITGNIQTDFTFAKISGVYYGWSQITLADVPSPDLAFPSDVSRFSALNPAGPWTQFSTPTLYRTLAAQGVGITNGQLADPSLVSDGTNLWMYYSADTNGVTGTARTIGVAKAASTTLAQLVLTSEGVQNVPIPDGLNLQLLSLASDNFTRANANPIGGNWSPLVAGSTAQLLSNAVTSHTAGTPGDSFWNALTWPADQWSTITLGTIVNGSFAGAYVRMSTGGVQTGYRLVLSGGTGSASSTLTLQKVVAGAFTQLGIVTQEVNVGDTLTVCVIGTEVSAYWNQVLLFVAVDAVIATGASGFEVDAVTSVNNVKITGWSGGTFQAAPPIPPISLGAYSVPDCRVPPAGPNASRTVQGTKIYDVQTSSNSAIPPVDSRAAGAPVDSRVSPNIPQNSRAPGTFGPGE